MLRFFNLRESRISLATRPAGRVVRRHFSRNKKYGGGGRSFYRSRRFSGWATRTARALAQRFTAYGGPTGGEFRVFLLSALGTIITIRSVFVSLIAFSFFHSAVGGNRIHLVDDGYRGECRRKKKKTINRLSRTVRVYSYCRFSRFDVFLLLNAWSRCRGLPPQLHTKISRFEHVNFVCFLSV